MSKVYNGDHRAVDEFSLDVADGEFMVLLGPSGCGKSTVLRMIAGLEPLTSGSVWFGRTNAAGLTPKDRGVAMVFETGALYPNRTVRENIMFPLLIAGEDPAEASAKASGLARVLGIDTALDQYPGSLSGGQRQRVAIGRAIVRKPKIFLMDEPLSNLDATMRTELRQEIGAMSRDLKVTTLYVTHDHVEAFTLADRIAIMRNGRIEDVGTPTQVYENPGTAFVAGFLGTPRINLMAATVRVTARHRVSLDFGGQSIALPPVDRRSMILSHHEGVRVIVGARSDALDMSPETDSPQRLTGTLRALEFHGNQWMAFVDCGLEVLNPDLIGLPAEEQAVPAGHRSSSHRAASPGRFATWRNAARARLGRTPPAPPAPLTSPTHRRSDVVLEVPAGSGLRPHDQVQLSVDVSRIHIFDELGHRVDRVSR